MTSKTHAPDYGLIAIVGVLTFFGLVMLTSASAVLGFEQHGDSFFFLKRQLLFGLLPGVIALVTLAKIPYQFWRKYSLWFLGFSVLLLVLVFIPGIGLKLGGSKSWISIAGATLQPSEIVKLTFLLYLAAWLERRGDIIGDFKRGFIPFALILGAVAGLIILQPDLGTLAVLVFVALVVYFAAGAPWRYIAGLVGTGLAVFYGLVKLAPYRISRLTVFLNPELDPQGIGYHINQALLAVGSGGLFGLGLGHSRQKFAYLPEAAGDSIFAIAAEELGFLVAFAVVVLFFYLVYRTLKIARHAPDAQGRILATGIAAWLGFQAFLNIGAMVGVFPITGLPLPFISQGGTAMLAVLAAAGILINISKQTGERVHSGKSKVRKR